MVEKPEKTQPYEPSPEQEIRRKALRRFNWWTVYLPITLLAAITLIVLVALILLTLEGRPQLERWRTFVSAGADVIIILVSFGLTLSCLLLPGLAITAIIYGRRQERRPLTTVQTLLWRVDTTVVDVKTRVEQISTKVAEGVIEGRSRVAYWEALIKWLKYWLFGH